MKVSVLINNYNYGKYVGEAISSVLQQTTPPDELIVVDDGSTDNSLEVIEKHLATSPRGRLVKRRNGGQLAAFNTGFSESSGDILFFLDADDCYEPDHIEKVLSVFREHRDVGFVFTSYRRTDKPGEKFIYTKGEGDLGPSAMLTLLSRVYVGSVTSATAIRRSVAGIFMPLPQQLENDWITRADDCLVFGASLTGTRKYFLPSPTLIYRIHGNNHFAERHQDCQYIFFHLLRTERLMQTLQGVDLHPLRMKKLLLKEFRLIPRPDRKCLRDYMRSTKLLRIPGYKRLSVRIALFRSYLAYWKSQTSDPRNH